MLKAIETRYKGYRFRSRLEARYAVFFDALGVRWEYEKEGFDLGEAGLYLPDFWLPQVKMWAEVKPEQFTDKELFKCMVLAQQSEQPVLLLVGVPQNAPYDAIEIEPDGNPRTIEYCLTSWYLDEHRFYCSPVSCDDWMFDDTAIAAEAARSARFEHGQRG
jgi:hypothetical protein